MGKKGTTFYFKNSAVNRASKVNIFIYNQNGKLVKVIKNAISGLTTWDGRDNHGNLLANGLYHYVVRSEVERSDEFAGKTWKKKQKLLISR
jgi:flagellar hook assembly protein FlgD